MGCFAACAAPAAELRDVVKASLVDVRGMAVSGIAINSLTDVTSGKVKASLHLVEGLTLRVVILKSMATPPR